MSRRIVDGYRWLITTRPWFTLAGLAVLVVAAAPGLLRLTLDASADSLTLDRGISLEYYRETRERFGRDDFLIISFTPEAPLFSDAVLADLTELRRRLIGLAGVDRVTSLLDVPVLPGPADSLADARSRLTTLRETDDRKGALEWLRDSVLYRDLLLSTDNRTTGLFVYLESLENAELSRTERLERQRRSIAQVRDVLRDFESEARVFLGGAPMIVADIVSSIERDLRIFGASVSLFVILLLTAIFRSLRSVVIAASCCAIAVVCVGGVLGWTGWTLTVVSANFVPLLLIFTLSLAVHLITRLRELAGDAETLRKKVVWDAVRSKFLPCLLTAATTMMAFGSMILSDVQPLVSLGWIMVIGLGMAFVIVMLALPAMFSAWRSSGSGPSGTGVAARLEAFARFVQRHATAVAWITPVLVVAAAVGLPRLSVENSFINNFKKSTEIYQGMQAIDRRLGGTVPLEVIVDAPPERDVTGGPASGEAEGEFAGMPDAPAAGEPGVTSGYWFNTFRLETVGEAHRYLDRLDATGKVLSMHSTLRFLERLNGGAPVDTFELAVARQKMSADVLQSLFDPYISQSGDHIRLVTRVKDSEPGIDRHALINDTRSELPERLGVAASRLHVTGLLVLYDEMLQSFVSSQLKTIAVVLAVVAAAFLIIFRSLRLSLVAMIPNLASALIVLGIMGWLGIPLDMMTIMIAAVTIGIAVDDTIHFVHRYRVERSDGQKPARATVTAFRTVGQALLYTSLTICLGFSVLAVSDFMPTIYFGLLVAFGMLVALIADLTILPVALEWMESRQPAGGPARSAKSAGQ